LDEGAKKDLVRQLRRQSLWLKESWIWLLDTKVHPSKKGKCTKARPKALDVGCGPGFVMDVLSERLDVRGIDMDPDMVSMCQARDLEVVQGKAENLPFDDGEFDIAYCSFLLLLVHDPLKVIKEMKRVSKQWVLALAEPDYGAWIDHPEGLVGLGRIITDGIKASGGDPFLGRKLRKIFHDAGLGAEVGAHPGVWDISQLREEFEGQRSLVRVLAGSQPKKSELERIEHVWEDALEKGTLFHYNPIFYALGEFR